MDETCCETYEYLEQREVAFDEHLRCLDDVASQLVQCRSCRSPARVGVASCVGGRTLCYLCLVISEACHSSSFIIDCSIPHRCRAEEHHVQAPA